MCLFYRDIYNLPVQTTPLGLSGCAGQPGNESFQKGSNFICCLKYFGRNSSSMLGKRLVNCLRCLWLLTSSQIVQVCGPHLRQEFKIQQFILEECWSKFYVFNIWGIFSLPNVSNQMKTKRKEAQGLFLIFKRIVIIQAESNHSMFQSNGRNFQKLKDSKLKYFDSVFIGCSINSC